MNAKDIEISVIEIRAKLLHGEVYGNQEVIKYEALSFVDEKKLIKASGGVNWFKIIQLVKLIITLIEAWVKNYNVSQFKDKLYS